MDEDNEYFTRFLNNDDIFILHHRFRDAEEFLQTHGYLDADAWSAIYKPKPMKNKTGA